MPDALYLIRLRFTTPLHLGTSRAEYDRVADYLHSDTLYAAIMQAWADLGIDHPALSGAADQPASDLDLGFVLSSLFPFRQVKEEAPAYFFPAPVGQLAEAGRGLDLADQKRLGKLRFLERSLFRDLLRGRLAASLLGGLEAWIPAKANDFLRPSGGWDSPFYRKETVSRNHVPPAASGKKGETEIFYVERLCFEAGSGLFGLARVTDPAALPKLKAALRYLQDEGLGSDRHAGHGLFTLKFEAAPDEMKALFEASEDHSYGVNLSLFCPTQAELPTMINDENVRYQLVKRGGWIGHAPYLSLRKNGVYMFGEGGIFRTDQMVAGKTVNLWPDLSKLGAAVPQVSHPIYRVGRSLFVPINLPSHED